MIRPLSNFIYKFSNGWTGVSALLITGVYSLLAMYPLTKCINANKSVPEHIMALDPFSSAADKTYLLQHLSQEGIACYRQMLALQDNIFPLFYGAASLLLLSWSLTMFFTTTSRWRRLNLLPVLFMVFDWTENILEMMVIDQYLIQNQVGGTLSGFTSIATTLKWGMGIITLLMILGGVIYKLNVKR